MRRENSSEPRLGSFALTCRILVAHRARLGSPLMPSHTPKVYLPHSLPPTSRWVKSPLHLLLVMYLWLQLVAGKPKVIM